MGFEGLLWGMGFKLKELLWGMGSKGLLWGIGFKYCGVWGFSTPAPCFWIWALTHLMQGLAFRFQGLG